MKEAALNDFADALSALGCTRDPIVVFNKSHSGSRLLAELLRGLGVHIGSRLNESSDALELLGFTSRIILKHYPRFETLWRDDEAAASLLDLARSSFSRHLSNFQSERYRAWGWKLCETLYTLPVIDWLFPKARYIHLVRDGRDVAFSNHRAPHDAYWRKIYFNTDAIDTWRGIPLTKEAYPKKSHLFNALHWRNSVLIGRAFSSMLRERSLEVRYEDLCHDFVSESRRIAAHLALTPDDEVIARLAASVRTASIGKHRSQPRRKVKQVIQLIGPTLASFGYGGS